MSLNATVLQKAGTNPYSGRGLTLLAGTAMFTLLSTSAMADSITSFTSGDLVVTEVNAQSTPTAANGNMLDTASPITLQEFSLNGTATKTNSLTSVGSLTLPQSNTYGTGGAISGEYGSASEGLLQLSGNNQYLTLMGYGVNAAAFNAPGSIYQTASGSSALGQSVNDGSAGAVTRDVAIIGANGGVNTSTALTSVYSGNNPRSVYLGANNSTIYTSGQGASTSNQGVFLTSVGSKTATQIDGSTDTRYVTEYNGALTVTRDNKSAKAAYVSRLTNATGGLPTSSAGLINTVLTPSGNNASNVTGVKNSTDNAYYTTAPGTQPAIYLNSTNGNNLNTTNAKLSPNSRAGNFVYASPEQIYYADSTTMYVTDSGSPKSGNADKAALGDGGLQKYTLNTTTGIWTLDYTLTAGLNGGSGVIDNAAANIASNANGYGGYNNDATGLFGLAGKTVNGVAELFVTTFGKNELDTDYLYSISDTLAYTTALQASSEAFDLLKTAAPGEEIKGVSFAPTAGSDTLTPVPEPATLTLLGMGLAGLGFARRRKATAAA